MTPEHTVAAVVIIYFAVVLGVGVAAARRGDRSAEDYFLAGRSVKTLVLFMALLGTNITPFVLMGIPGLAYHHGVGVFGQNAAIIVLGVPLSVFAIGLPSWRLARRLGAVTPAELYARRFNAPWLGRLMFAVYFVYTVPYMVTAVSGVGIAVDVLSREQVGFATASAAILIVTLVYTSVGGMRGTMWTNVLQGGIFMLFSLGAFFWIAADRGGLSSTMQRVMDAAPRLMDVPSQGPFAAGPWLSWALCISLCVIAFPHMLVRIFAARDEQALKNVCRLYPVAMFFLWVPCVCFGLWGVLDIPGLEGRASDRVFPMLVRMRLGAAAQGLALASILAAVMSTLDAQMLTLSSMLSRDVLPRRLSERRQLLVTRGFIAVLAVITWVFAMLKLDSIFALAALSFSGYVTLIPTMVGAIYSRRFNASAAAASILTANVVMLAVHLTLGREAVLLPVAWGLLAGVIAAVLATPRRASATQPPHERQG